MEQLSIESPQVLEAQNAFDMAPSLKTLAALEQAKNTATIATAQAKKERLAAEAKAKAEKQTRLTELRQALTVDLDAKIEERARRIADKMLECLPIIQQWLDTEFDAANRDYFEARELAESLGEPVPMMSPPLNALALRSSQIIQSRIPEGMSPTALTAYAGSHWGV